DRGDDPADHLLDARLAFRRAEPAAEVLLRDDVGRRLRPELRKLDALLVEDRLVLAGDEGISKLPLHLLERVAPGNREVALHPDRGRFVDDGVHDLVARGFGRCGCLHARHRAPPRIAASTRLPGRPLEEGPGRVGLPPDGAVRRRFAGIYGPTRPAGEAACFRTAALSPPRRAGACAGASG